MYGFLVTDGGYPIDKEEGKTIIYGKYTFLFNSENSYDKIMVMNLLSAFSQFIG